MKISSDTYRSIEKIIIIIIIILSYYHYYHYYMNKTRRFCAERIKRVSKHARGPRSQVCDWSIIKELIEAHTANLPPPPSPIFLPPPSPCQTDRDTDLEIETQK